MSEFGEGIVDNGFGSAFGRATATPVPGSTPFMGDMFSGGNFAALEGGNAMNQGMPFGALSAGFGPNTDDTSGGISDILAQFGKDGKFQGAGALLGGASSLFGAWNGYQKNKLAKKQFDMASKYAALNASNNAIVTNEALASRRGGRRAAFGGNAGKGPQVAATI